MRNTPQSTANQNARVTSISVTGNEGCAFYDGSKLLRVFGVVRNIEISRDRQYIVITQLDESRFSFDVWRLLAVGAVAYAPLNKFDPNAQAQYNQRIDDIFYNLSVRIFKSCCDCTSGSTPSPSFAYEWDSSLDSGDFYFVSGVLFMSPYGADGQYLGDLLSVLPEGSWITFMSQEDATSYVVYEVSDYQIFSGIISFTASIVSGSSVAFVEETLFNTQFDKDTTGGGGGVESVTGNVVDNTDPLNPVVTAVASVTGDSVDNADPANPVVNAIPYDASLQTQDITGGEYSVDPASSSGFTVVNGNITTRILIADGALLLDIIDSVTGEQSIVGVDLSTGQFEIYNLTGDQASAGCVIESGIVSSFIRSFQSSSVQTHVHTFVDRLEVAPPSIAAGTAVNGQVLTLIDNTTGEAEWQDGGGTWIDFSGGSGCNPQGFSALTDETLRYRVDGKTVEVVVRIVGTSNAGSFTFTLPFAASAAITDQRIAATMTNNGTQQLGRIVINASSTTASVTLANGGSVTASNPKNVIQNFFYEID